MNKILLFIVLHITLFSFGYTPRQAQVYKTIEQNNRRQDFKTSIVEIHKIIHNSKSTDLDKYEAYYLKYVVYKRLYNFSEAKDNLDLAQGYADKTIHRESLRNKYQLELLLIQVELRNYKGVADKYSDLQSIKTLELDRVDQALLKFLEAVVLVETSSGNAKQALKLVDESIEVLQEFYPEYVSVVLRLKIKIYTLLNQYNTAYKIYEQDIYLAKNYNTISYEIDLYRSMVEYYKEIGDYGKSLEYSRLVLDQVTLYNATEKSTELKLIEKQLNEEENLLLLHKKERDFYIMIAILVLLLIGVYYLVLVFKRRKRAVKQIEKQNSQMQLDIKQLQDKLKGIDIKSYSRLSKRQKQIVDLVQKGKTNKEIGETLFISENTVKYHLKIIYEILQIKGKADLLK
ncbi:helix-turn-helix domain-containing protein [Myroides marinus]|uniref:helix-turn-helix domain-containing protein n=1 Tax=Myroides marinus TaxID=703342 RepID=UPI0009B832CB|nr:helix-turn-helix transcriptional regulator [Myroides marinus]MDM1371562.1 helix-turn-helix transcriptional regulator [Myroides marinus]MDM1379040.1 helix-turn-helix transcriptional regulator [Myroides marinus]MDM1386311.1 helix-turn-helix transcriptional regulator [Myroides marinus]MDM1393619.1 helix-turn-helix transcriptional regulator [Myroides marinus]